MKKSQHIRSALLSIVVLTSPAANSSTWYGFGGHTGGCNGVIYAAEGLPDGRIVVGGVFRSCGNSAATSIAIYDPGTGLWSSPGGGIRFSSAPGEIQDIMPYEGGFAVAGAFTNSGGVPTQNVSVWDGSTWRALGSGLSTRVYDLEVHDGAIFAGGQFSGGAARFDGSSWTLLGLASTVFALRSHGGNLYAGGTFEAQVGALNLTNIAYYSGGAWREMGPRWGDSATGRPRHGCTAAVFSFSVFGGEVYASGIFNGCGTTSLGSIGKWSGTAWQPLGSGGQSQGLWGGPPPTSASISGEWEGRLLVAGSFTHAGAPSFAGGLPVDGLATWGGNWAPATFPRGEFSPVVVGNSLYGIRGGVLARLSGGGQFLPVPTATQGTSLGTDGRVRALLMDGERIYAGGTFSRAGSVAANGIAFLEGGRWNPIGSGIGATAGTPVIQALVVYRGELYAAGFFSTVGETPARSIARWDGQAWTAVGTGASNGVNGTVNTLFVYKDELYVGGNFTQAGSSAALRVAKWNGSEWLQVGSGFGDSAGNDEVFALTQHAGSLVAGGRFTSSGATLLNSVAQLTAGQWVPLAGGITTSGGAPGVVSDLASWNGRLIAGGAFARAGGLQANNVAQWQAGAWSAIGPGASIGNVVSLAVDGGTLIAAGDFTALGGVSAQRIARFEGGSWMPLAPGANNGPDAVVDDIITTSNGEYVFGGQFSTVAGQTALSLAGFGFNPDGVFTNGFDD